MNKYKVILYFTDPDGIQHPLGAGIFWCDTAKDARECGIDTWWDPRLEAAGCHMSCYVTPLLQYRAIWEFDDSPDCSWLEQWDTPEKYYDVQPRCPKCGDTMSYVEGHEFKCDADFEDDPESCDGRFDANEHAGRNAGIMLEGGKDGTPVPFEDYKAYHGDPNRHAMLLCRVEQRCNDCGGWETAEVLGNVDFMDDDNFETGCFHETELDQISNEYQLLTTKDLLDEAKGDSFFPALGEHLREMRP
jgi:hypothetical protein